MKILAFLQNMWFKDPEVIRAIFAKYPDRRNDLIARFLFMRCLTGKRLKACLGDALCSAIIWEECSPEIGDHSSSAFIADPEHMHNAIRSHNPDLILVLGEIAKEAFSAPQLENANLDIPIFYGPHPAARRGALKGLRQLRDVINSLLPSALEQFIHDGVTYED